MLPDLPTVVALLIVLAVMVLVGHEAVRWLRSLPNRPVLTLLLGINHLYCKLICRVSLVSPVTIPRRGPAIVVSNHRSTVDPLVLQYGNERVISFFIAREYYELFGMHWIYEQYGCISVNRTGTDVAATRTALRRLRQGGVIGIFPEGRINVAAKGLLPAHSGVALLALRARVSVVPVVVVDAPPAHTLVGPLVTPSRVRVKYGPPIDLSRYFHQAAHRETLREVTDLIMREVAALGESLGVPMDTIACAHPTTPDESAPAAPVGDASASRPVAQTD